jgi:sulfur relay (sulfurtransferase) complex TusBCD TusD component (DsrE family)
MAAANAVQRPRAISASASQGRLPSAGWSRRGLALLGERLGKVAREQNILLMLCGQCVNERGLARPAPAGRYQPVDVVEGVLVGCFPDLYAALATNPPDQVISL